MILFITVNINAQNFFKYKISKTYNVFIFMETAISSHGTSSTFENFIVEKTKNNIEFQILCEDYKKINLNNQYELEGFPKKRNNYGNSFDVISMNAVNAKSFEDFQQKNLGIITLSDNLKLIQILKKAEIFYDKLIWNEFEKNSKNQLKSLSKFENSNTVFFEKFNHFYNSTWTKDIPFNVVIYPIPGNNGNTIATPHINALCVSLLTEDKDMIGLNGVALHEMCHVLYENQSKEIQITIDNYFNQNKSIYSKQAYTYINEALATVLGNGFAIKEMNGKLDKNDWYADKTINDFAKAIYPMVENYLNENKSIDKEFVDNAIQLFSEKFPKSIYDYAQSLNRTISYTEDFEELELVNQLSNYFTISSLDLVTPIIQKNISEKIINNSNQFFIIDKNQNETLLKLSEYFPEIKDIKFENKLLNLSFIDSKNRTIVILVLNNKSELNSELKKMKEKQFFDSKSVIQN